MTVFTRRRFIQASGAAAATPLVAPLLGTAHAQTTKTLTIAYNVALPSWDPTVGPSAVNPTIQSLYHCVFDPYIDQNPDLSFRPGLLTEWGWSEDRKQAHVTVREGATWHDGTPVT